MRVSPSTPTTAYVKRLQWQLPLLVIALVTIDQLISHVWLQDLPDQLHFLSQIVFYALAGLLFAAWAVGSLNRGLQVTQAAQRDVLESNRRLDFLYRAGKALAHGEDETQICELVEQLVGELVDVELVIIDYFDSGDLRSPHLMPNSALEERSLWHFHLTGGSRGQSCSSCGAVQTRPGAACPMAAMSGSDSSLHSVRSVPLLRGDRHCGNLHLVLRPAASLAPAELKMINALASELALTLEVQRIHSRGMDALDILRQARRQASLEATLRLVMAQTCEALEAHGALLIYQKSLDANAQASLVVGDLTDRDLTILQKLCTGLEDGDLPLVLANAGKKALRLSTVHTLMIASAAGNLHQRGVLVVWFERARAVSNRQLRLANVVASQLALLIDNDLLGQSVEYRAILDERARLARELHDGFAQNLAYLRLSLAQLTNEHASGQLSVANEINMNRRTMDGLLQLVDELYADMRTAIDGLRVESDGQGGFGWLSAIQARHAAVSDIVLHVGEPPVADIPLEVHAQLIRFVQEALSNACKHAEARDIWITWRTQKGQLLLSVCDNGIGFDAEHLPTEYQHGLSNMRERAELIGGAFQMSSRLGSGTELTLQVPLAQEMEESTIFG